MKLLHSVAVQDVAISADGVFNYDMAVNPLSVILIQLRPLNETATLTNFQSYMGIANAINRASLSFRGESVISMRGEDAVAMAYFRHGIMPFQGQHDHTDNERRNVVVPLVLGKHPYDPNSCFPASRRGELNLELDLDIADTGYDALRLQIDTIELLDAKPKEYERQVQVIQTLAATGDVDIDLPPGNLNRGMLLFGTTPFAGAVPAPSWGRIKTLLDNQETGYAAIDWETAQMLHCLWGRQPPSYDAHIHGFEPIAGVVTIYGPTKVGMNGFLPAADTGWCQYAFLDFDVTKDDMFSIDTRNHSRFHVRANAETADAVRVIPVEVIRQ